MAWEFLEITIKPLFSPPQPGNSGGKGGGMPDGSPSGENNMITIKRLVTVANGKIWYENVGET